MAGAAASSHTGNGNADDPPLFGGGHFVPLLYTQQEFDHIFLDGRRVRVFDHPLEPSEDRICNQGSAFPDGPQQTCGCCSCATLINMARGSADERSVVTYALGKGYCKRDGSTSPQSWINILADAGIRATDHTGESLRSLADKVEEGYGVQIGVMTGIYGEKIYGPFVPGVSGGHSLVLESVIRDEKTGEIIEYVVVDSNGESSSDAAKRVSPHELEAAFGIMGSPAIVTDDVIW